MGREKRKGKDIVIAQPVRKWTRAKKEAEMAEMVAKAAQDQASGRARPFRIQEQPVRGRGRGRAGRASRATAEQTQCDLSEA